MIWGGCERYGGKGGALWEPRKTAIWRYGGKGDALWGITAIWFKKCGCLSFGYFGSDIAARAVRSGNEVKQRFGDTAARAQHLVALS